MKDDGSYFNHLCNWSSNNFIFNFGGHGAYSNKSLQAFRHFVLSFLFGNISRFCHKRNNFYYIFSLSIASLIWQIIPLLFMWVLTFIMIDLVFYFYQMSHRVSFAAIHMTHHSSEQMNFSVSFRQAWLHSWLTIFYGTKGLGFDPMIIAVAGGCTLGIVTLLIHI